MVETSLVHAKTHLSELVDDAEHHGKVTVILRHGKPAAAIVPLSIAHPKAKHPPLTRRQAEALLRQLGEQGDPSVSAVQDLLEARR